MSNDRSVGPVSTEVKELAELLRARAQAQRWIGWGLLGAILACILLTGLLVMFAGKAIESATAEGVEGPPLIATFQVYESANASLAGELAARLKASIPETDPDHAKRMAEIDGLSVERQRLANQLNSTIQLTDQRTAAMAKAQAMFMPILGAVVARISFVLLGLFLVQVLVGSYRAASRLAASYDAFSDALMMQGAGLGDLKTVVAALTPTVEFSGGGKAPTREIVDLVTGLLRQQAPAAAKKD